MSLSITAFGVNANLYYSGGLTAFSVGNYQKAEEYLKKALTLNPSLENDSNIKNLIGLSALYSGDLVTARAYISNDSLLSTQIKTSKMATRSLINQIVDWEKITKQTVNSTKEIPSWAGVLIFLAFATIFTVGFLAYLLIKRRKPLAMAMAYGPATSIDENVKEEADPDGFKNLPSNDFPTFEDEEISDIPADEDVQKRLEDLLGTQGTQKGENDKKAKVVEDPEKIVQKVHEDPSEEELFELTQAIQEILFKESDSSDK